MQSDLVGDLEDEGHLLACERRLPVLREAAEKGAQIQLAIVEHFAARIETGEREQVVEQRFQARRVFLHDFENLGLLRARHFREIDQVLDVTGEDRDRGPQFMRDLGDDLAADFFEGALRRHIAQNKKRSLIHSARADGQPPRFLAARDGHLTHFVFGHPGELLPNELGKPPAHFVCENNFSLRVEQKHTLLDPRENCRPVRFRHFAGFSAKR